MWLPDDPPDLQPVGLSICSEPSPGQHFGLSPKVQLWPLQNDLEKARARRQLKLWIFARKDRRLQTVLGHISLSNIVRGAFRSCFLGYATDQTQTEQGLMTEALGAVVQLAFQHLERHRLDANIMPANQALHPGCGKAEL